MNTELTSRKKTQTDILNEYGSERLKDLLRDFPFFSAGHLLHAFQEKGKSEADILWNKALLYGGESKWISFVFQQLNNPETGFIERSKLHEASKMIGFKKDEPSHIDEKQDLEDSLLDAETLNEAADAQDVGILNELEDEQDAILDVKQKGTADLSQSANQSLPEKTGSEVLFEPFHTVDYFASQGIRLKEEKLGDDALGKQVKTFTQWLRSMKKIYVEEQGTLDKNEEDRVIRIADTSNKDELILTETMAQVYIQQGKMSKAAEVYQKLSLLHPEKSSYFATLLENLNERK